MCWNRGLSILSSKFIVLLQIKHWFMAVYRILSFFGFKFIFSDLRSILPSDIHEKILYIPQRNYEFIDWKLLLFFFYLLSISYTPYLFTSLVRLIKVLSQNHLVCLISKYHKNIFKKSYYACIYEYTYIVYWLNKCFNI